MWEATEVADASPQIAASAAGNGTRNFFVETMLILPELLTGFAKYLSPTLQLEGFLSRAFHHRV